MKALMIAAAVSVIAFGPALAQGGMAPQGCKAVGSDGKPLVGAAKESHMKKCCEDSAVGSDGKRLAGAAKDSHMKKCMAG